MELKNLVNKGTLLLGSMFVLAACGANNAASDKKEEARMEETTAMMKETTEAKMEETTAMMEETTEAKMDETTAMMDETTAMMSEMEALKDGEYKLESNADERGWAHSFTIVVKDGKITESKYDMVDKDGKLKSENEEYNKMMEEKSGASFAKAVEAYNKGLVEKQNVADVESVSGATSTYDSFAEYAKLLLEAAAKGNTETIKVEVK
ncbi:MULTISPECIES: FMN-binding protein [unclassified Facklamia]|uniref:FMN-binding protein n=1 Tax=Aerococcaceae TaxID=186827 RepID=UPI0013B86774|nr:MULTISPECIES: FMN-binding protein [unclassified Facklamia]NEW63730.1 FMN-binding protein [Facklamia sp. 252]NEW67201.1 FMN-binding protein [Facklamia sp. 253]QQD66260.1 FMN-binding protein [Aerococcaceae bacterium zg-252]